MNKFLKQYPQLRTPKIGDKIIMTNTKINRYITEHIIWYAGDIGRIINIYDTDIGINKEFNYKIDLNLQGNKIVYQDGIWHVSSLDFKLYE